MPAEVHVGRTIAEVRTAAEQTSVEAVAARVLVVDDHALFRTGVANIINQEADLRVVAEAANGARTPWRRSSTISPT